MNRHPLCNRCKPDRSPQIACAMCRALNRNYPAETAGEALKLHFPQFYIPLPGDA